jgi:hypothetical protein
MHQKNKITFLNSFEEMEEDQLKYFASLSSEELLKNHKKMSMAAFGLKKEPDIKKRDRRIKFAKKE